MSNWLSTVGSWVRTRVAMQPSAGNWRSEFRPLTHRLLEFHWWLAASALVLLLPLHLWHTGPGDWTLDGLYAGLTLLAWLVARRSSRFGIGLYFLGQIGLTVWYAQTPGNLIAWLGLGALGDEIAAVLPTVGLGAIGGFWGASVAVALDLILLPLRGGSGQQLVGAYIVIVAGAAGVFLHALGRQLRAAARELERAALCDPMTGLGNRRALELDHPRYVALAERQGKPLLLSLWDLNGLKRVNDVQGHAAGDAFLNAFAHTLLASARQGDAFYRVGGDEFIGLHLGLEDGHELRRRVLQGFADVSVGWASPYTTTLEATMTEADRMLYLDKHRTPKVDST